MLVLVPACALTVTVVMATTLMIMMLITVTQTLTEVTEKQTTLVTVHYDLLLNAAMADCGCGPNTLCRYVLDSSNSVSKHDGMQPRRLP